MTNPAPPRKVTMNSITTDEGETLQAALTMGALGYKIIPIPPGQKYPKGLSEWQKKATNDHEQIIHWWGSGEAGIGWAMGLQPNGSYLVAIDVDVSDGKVGKTTMEALIKTHGLKSAFSATTSQRTGTGGYHFIFEADAADHITNGVLGEHVDIRGEGGFIVCAPSIHPNGNAYRWTKAPWDHRPIHLSPVIAGLLAPPPPSPTPPPPLRFHHDDDPIEWIKSQFRCEDFIERLGWQRGPTAGTQTKYTRPGKSVKEGHSAVYHADVDVFNVFTTTVEPGFESFGHHSRSGVLTLNAFDLWCISNGVHTVAEAMSIIRKQLMPSPTSNLAVAAPAVIESSSLNLGDEFWESRDVLGHIRQAAWSMSASPDAVLAGVLARYSANIPPAIRLPRMGTLDVFFVIAGHSGSGKSSAGKVAGQLYAGNYAERGVMMDRQVGSGEGLAEAFFEWRDEDGAPCSSTKKGATKVLAKWGMHFATDEGAALTASAGRSGSILIPTLCAAWMGESIGQLLADPTKSRMIGPMRVRVSAEVRIQTAHGYKLFAEEYASTGLSQRMICVSAVDPSIHQRYEAGILPPPWPGPLELAHPAIIGGETTMELCDELVALFAQYAAEAHNPHWVGDPLDTHSALSTLKIAGILALWENRLNITTEDWEIASLLLVSHRSVRSMLQATKIHADNQRRVTSVTMEAEKVVAINDAQHQALLKRTVESIETIIKGGEFPSKNKLSRPQREVYEEAKTILEAQGKWPK
jgi:hypothetical protein